MHLISLSLSFISLDDTDFESLREDVFKKVLFISVNLVSSEWVLLAKFFMSSTLATSSQNGEILLSLVSFTPLEEFIGTSSLSPFLFTLLFFSFRFLLLCFSFLLFLFLSFSPIVPDFVFFLNILIKK